MHFSAEEVETYHRQGYLAGPRVLSDEQLETLKGRIDDILAGRTDLPPHLLGETVEKSRAKGQLPSVKVVNLFRHDPVFAHVYMNPAISALAHDLMTGPVRVWEDQMIYKPAYDSQTALAWHRDYTFWDHVGPADMATCWIALDDATVDNGCMHVLPGSHHWQLDFSREDVDVSDPEWLLKHPQLPAERAAPTPCPVPAGHCHFHHCQTLHGSYGNSTDNMRRSYVLHLMPGHTRRLGDSWNERMGRVENVAVGEVVSGPQYPELPAAEPD
jgi:ectoine hydroxylase-related dioxygenase (phytanoyl-CoA dioxygenase family)